MKNTSLNHSPNLDTAIKFHQKGDLLQAEMHYQKAILERGNSSKAKNYLGMIHFTKGNAAIAIQLWKESAEEDTKYIEPRVNLASIHLQQKDFKTALSYFKEAIKIDPKRHDLIQQAAQLASEMNNTKEAVSLITPALKHSPLNPNMHLILALIHVQSGDSIEAEKVLKHLLSKSPNLPEAWINLGHIYVERDKKEAAKSYFTKAYNANQQHPQALYELGKFLSENGEVSQGVELLKKAQTLTPNDWRIPESIGAIMYQLGQFEEAIIYHKKALELQPNSLSVKQSLSRVLTRFVPPWHLKMLADHERNEAFEKAIQRIVNKDTVVLDIGTGSGILSMMSAKHGAKQVYTCETSTHIAEVAEKIIEANGFKNKVKLFKQKSTELTPTQLAEKPNVIVAEIFDAGLIGELAIPTFRHALKELCTTDCKVIPSKANVVGRLLHLPSSASVNPMKNISGFDLSAFDQFRIPKEYISEDLKLSKHRFLSNEFDLIDYDFANLGEPIPAHTYKTKTITVESSDEGALHGVAFWFNLFLDEEVTLSSAPERLNNHWGQALFFFEEHMMLSPRQQVQLTMCFNDVSIWFEAPRLIN